MKPKEIQQHNKARIKAISAFLKEYRIQSGYSQQELSECSQISRNTIVRYESNKPCNKNLYTIFAIADALELDIKQIFQEIE